MNTPAHVVMALAVWGRGPSAKEAWWAAAGGVLPDLPMFVFYAVEKARGVAESVIWSRDYYLPGWQTFFDVFNSLPAIGLAWWITRTRDHPVAAAFLGAMGLHALTDLPVHGDDAHRHFLPVSNYRFESPVSYWDPASGGLYIAAFEVLFVLAASVWIVRSTDRPSVRWLVGGLGAVYVAYFAFAAVVWVGL